MRELSDRFERPKQIFRDSFQLSSKQAKTTEKVKSSNTKGEDATVVNKNPATRTKSCDFELYMCSETKTRKRRKLADIDDEDTMEKRPPE